MSFRPCVLVITALAACATASSQQPGGTTDAPPGHSDAPGGGDGLPPHIDAAIDAPPGSCQTPFTGALATWSFTGESGSQAQTAATAMATGVTAGPVSRSSALTVASGVGSINSSNWPTAAALDSTKYYTFSVTPPTGCSMDLTKLSIDAKSSGTGPTMAVVATSNDSYGATAAVSTTAASMPALTVTGATGAIEIRVFGFAASGTGGTMRIQNTLTVTGSLH
jgi:hypothetical protein